MRYPDTAYDDGAHLNFNDVAVDGLENPKMLRLRITASKTDPLRVGVDIFVGRTGIPSAQWQHYSHTWRREAKDVVHSFASGMVEGW